MRSRMSKTEFFDRVADNGYWRDFNPEQMPRVRRLLKALSLSPGMLVFEPGCGTGRLTARLAEAVSPGGRVIANDISPRMIALARRRKLGRCVQWIVAPVESVRVRAGSLDRVVCFQSFPHFDDKPAVLRRFHKALKPDGLLAVVHFISRRRVNDIHRGESPPICHDLLPPKREMAALLREGGFEIIEFEDGRDGYRLFARPVNRDRTGD